MDPIDLTSELIKIRSRGAEVSSTTLLKTDTLRIVLMALQAGARLHEHHADGRISIQVLEGEIDFRAENVHCKMRAGMLVSADAMVRHEVVAASDAAFLLTIAWPSKEQAQKQAQAGAHRGVGYAN